jgi:hypothetical protein
MVIAACTLPGLGAGLNLNLPPETARLRAGPGAELANAYCILCHSADYISTQPRLSRVSWRAAVEKMRDKYGAPIPADKVDTLAEYLVKNYGLEISTNKPPRAQ